MEMPPPRLSWLAPGASVTRLVKSRPFGTRSISSLWMSVPVIAPAATNVTVNINSDATLTGGQLISLGAGALITNNGTVQAINRNQAAANANTVSGIIAPRVMRFGINVRW